MFALQRLYAPQILPEVIVVQSLVLLLYPILGLVNVSVEALNFVRRTQLGGFLGCQLLERCPLRVQFLRRTKNEHDILSVMQKKI